jgi:chemotaxis signal transduction protein
VTAMIPAPSHPETLPELDDAWTGFELAGEIFAFRYHVVERVLAAAGSVTALPFAPACVEGVVSIAGGVLPVVALGALLFPERPTASDRGNELLVIDVAGQRFAVRVDGVIFVAAPLANRSPAHEVDAPAIEGVAEWRGRKVACLAVERLGLERLRPCLPPRGAPGMVADDRIESAAIAAASAATVLAIAAGGVACALPAASVAELLAEVAMTPLPLVPPVLLGVVILRRAPLPVLSLARLLGFPQTGRIGGYVVVTSGPSRFVLAVGEIGGLRRGDETLRMLDPTTLIEAGFPGSASLAAAPDIAEAAVAVRGGRFLSLSIGDRFCAVPLAEVDRIHAPRPPIRLPAGAPPGIDGAVEVGGRILPLTEGRRWLSLPAGERPPGAHVVLRHDRERRVLTVDAVHRVVTIADRDILSARDSGQSVAAIGRIGGRSIVILSAAQVMSGESAA